MNTPELRLLDIWRCVVEMKDVQPKMEAYEKIAKEVGITERNVRGNISKLVEIGYLVETDNWYATNFDSEFVKYIIKEYKDIDYDKRDPIKEEEKPADFVSKPMVSFQFGPTPPGYISWEVEFDDESVDNFRNTFGSDAREALRFFKKQVLLEKKDFYYF